MASEGKQVEKITDQFAENIKKLFAGFLEDYSSSAHSDDGLSSQSNSSQPIKDYLVQLDSMKRNDRTTLYVDFQDMVRHKQVLADSIAAHYHRVEPYLMQAVKSLLAKHVPDHTDDDRGEKSFHVSFHNFPEVEAIRGLKTIKIGQLTSISGTVTRTSQVRPELTVGAFTCLECFTEQSVLQQFKYTEPTMCLNPACTNRKRWKLLPQKSTFTDWQKMRIQENNSEIPAGSMPRSLEVILRNEIVERAKPGDKVVVTGSLVVVPDVSMLSRGGSSVTAVRRSNDARIGEDYSGVTGLKALGVRDLTYKMYFLASYVHSQDSGFDVADNEEDAVQELTPEEKQKIHDIRHTPKLYTKMARSVAPTCFGHDEIKKGILLMLFGGVHKVTPSGSNLRGDINVCIVGDPSTSKSQFLKYVCSFLPRAVYTSGKASSAAGLTASVVRDKETGEFGIEAGALMLADNAICCIDEFDKMDVQDQVAIHEAMEQQTISITKAGIQATLNARTAILAAANPIKGRYDTSRTLRQNVDISAPIMSRFDLFFVVVDVCSDVTDRNIAKHIVNIHRNTNKAVKVDFTKEDLQLYVRFARTIKPKISPEAQQVFVEHYRKLRQNDTAGPSKTAYRITVRQLESMVRLSEALARLHLEDKILPRHVHEAARLIQQSIIRIDAPPISMEDDEFGEYDDEEEDNDDDDDEEEEDDDDDQGDKAAAASTSNRRASSRQKGKKSMEEDEEETQEATATAGSMEVDDDNKSSRSSSSRRRKKTASMEEDQGEDEAAKKKKKRKKKKKVHISYEEYVSVASLVTGHVREEENKEGADGVRESELIDWALKAMEEKEEAADEEKLALLGRKVKHIITRLIKVDGVLQIINAEEQEKKQDQAEAASSSRSRDRLLAVNPNYDPTCAAEFVDNHRREMQRKQREDAKREREETRERKKEAKQQKAEEKERKQKEKEDREKEKREESDRRNRRSNRLRKH